MKVFLSAAVISAILTSFCNGQDIRPLAVQTSASDKPSSAALNSDPVAYHAALNLRLVEYKAQSELLTSLAQEHSKRAAETLRDQEARAQWERELAKELNDKSLALVVPMNNTRKERLAFEQAHPDLAATVLPNPVAGAAAPLNPDEIAFMEKLQERIAATQQEIDEALEAGKVYTAQLQTNTAAYGFSKIASELQVNANVVKQLQKEVAGLELKKLEYRAWTSRAGVARWNGQ